MSERIRFRLGELLGLAPACEFLDEQETLDWSEGRLSQERRVEWQQHTRTCASCVEMDDDFETLQRLATDGLTVAGEARAFAEHDTRVREKLGLTRRRLRAWQIFAMWLTPTIAAGLVALLLLRPADPFMIATVEQPAFVPPPAVRGVSVAEHWDAAGAAWTAGDFEAAAGALVAALDEYPETADFAFYLGLARMRLQDWDGAAEALRRADELQAGARSETTLWAWATALDRARRNAEACEVLESLVSLEGRRAREAGAILDENCR